MAERRGLCPGTGIRRGICACTPCADARVRQINRDKRAKMAPMLPHRQARKHTLPRAVGIYQLDWRH